MQEAEDGSNITELKLDVVSMEVAGAIIGMEGKKGHVN